MYLLKFRSSPTSWNNPKSSMPFEGLHDMFDTFPLLFCWLSTNHGQILTTNATLGLLQLPKYINAPIVVKYEVLGLKQSSLSSHGLNSFFFRSNDYNTIGDLSG